MQKDFVKRANMMRTEYLLKTEALFLAERKGWFSDFGEHFKAVCARIRELQEASVLSAISYLEYTMLYVNFINRRYIAEVCVYGDENYLDEKQLVVDEYDVSFLFIYFDKLWDELLAMRKRYVGKVSARDVMSFMLEILPDFYSYLVSIARYAIVESVESESFIDIDRNETFKVNVGDYMASTEPVFVESKNKDAKSLSKRILRRIENENAYDDYSELDFTGQSFKYTEFRYSHFRRSCLNRVSLEGSILNGASFYKSKMENCCMDNSTIYEADFSYAVLRKASFVNAQGRAGLANEKEWSYDGFLPVRFRYADLTNADFSGANLVGADFTCAILSGACFAGANLTDADFSGAELDGADFTGAIGTAFDTI